MNISCITDIRAQRDNNEFQSAEFLGFSERCSSLWPQAQTLSISADRLFSFLNDQAFFAVSGYAGKRQFIKGNPVPGAEVPKDFSEITVRKNYYWKLGFEPGGRSFLRVTEVRRD